MVDTLGVGRTVVPPALVIVWPAGQVVTLVETTTVVRTVDGTSGEPGTAGAEAPGPAGVDACVFAGGAEAPVNGIELGQLVIKPGFCGDRKSVV